MTVIRSFPRLHVSLFDLAGATGRKHGGAGFAIDGLPTRIVVSAARNLTIIVENDDGAAAKEIQSALSRLSSVVARPLIASIGVSGTAPRHLGLGWKTATIMGVLQAMNEAFALDLPASAIQELSGRGGTSGIGVNSFFSGQFIIDGGHPQDRRMVFGPSSRQSGFLIPPVIFRTPIPEQWRFHLYDVPDGLRRFGTDEAEFFRTNTPVASDEVFELIAVAYHMLAPAVINADLELLRTGISRISELGFKKREIEGQSDDVRALIANLLSYRGCAVGMSSMGPLVYAITRTGDTLFSSHIEAAARTTRFTHLGTFPGRNSGFGVGVE